MPKYFIQLVLGLLSIAVFLTDLIKNPETLKGLLGYSSGFISFILLVSLIFARLIQKESYVSVKIKLFFFIIFISFLILGSIFSYLNFTIHPNIVYSSTFINTRICIQIALVSFFVWLILQNNKFWLNKFRKIIFLTPLLILYAAILMLTWPSNEIGMTIKEDGLIENLQAILLLVGSIASLLVSSKLFKSAKILSILFILISIFLFVIFGDEISWGQRFFNLETPPQLKEINSQSEITIHNNKSLHGYVPYGYLLIGFYGSILTSILRSQKKFSKKNFSILFPTAELFLYR